MRVFLRVSLIITKVGAGPRFFTASTIAAEVGPQLHKKKKKLKMTPLNLISHGSSFRDFQPPQRPDMRPALYQPSAAAVGRMQSCFICIAARASRFALPLYSPPPRGVFCGPGYIYIPHMLSDSRPPAAEHSLPCEGCQFVYMLMLLFPSRPPASSGRPLTIPLCSKVTRRSVVILPDFTYTSGSGFSTYLLFFFFFHSPPPAFWCIMFISGNGNRAE